MHKNHILVIILSIFVFRPDLMAGSAVFTNPGLPNEFSLIIRDRIDRKTGWVTAKVEISKFDDGANSYFRILSSEGSVFRTVSVINARDLSTVSEKRYDAKTGECLELFENNNGLIAFYNGEKGINKEYREKDHGIYSRYAYFISFMGFPFESKKEVTFKSYICEYRDALPMKLIHKGKETVRFKSGNVECYKLELSVGGWQSIFARDKYYFYFSSKKPHYFVKYEQKEDDGKWYANELLGIIVNKQSISSLLKYSSLRLPMINGALITAFSMGV